MNAVDFNIPVLLPQTVVILDCLNNEKFVKKDNFIAIFCFLRNCFRNSLDVAVYI